MSRAFQIFAALLALGGAAYFVITAQQAAVAQAQPADAPQQQAAPASKATASADSAASAASKAPASKTKPEPFLSGSKAFAPGDGVFLGGSKAAPVMLDPPAQQAPGTLQGTLVGEQPGAAAVDTRGVGTGAQKGAKNAAKKGAKTNAPAAPKSRPFMGGSKFDTSGLQLPPRPKSDE